MAAAAWQFPELLAGLVATSGAVEGDVRASASEGAPPPGLDTPAGIETLLGGTHTPQHTKAAASPPAEPRTKEPERQPDAELTAAGRTISSVTPQSALASLAAGPNLPMSQEIVALSAGNGEATAASAAPSPEQLPGVANQEGQTAAARVPPRAAHGEDWQSREVSVAAGRNLLPQSGRLATRISGQAPTVAVEAPPAEAAVDRAPASPPQAIGGAPQPSAEFPPAAVGTLVAEKSLESPLPGTAERAARQQDGRSLASPLKTPPAATAAPTGDAPADGKEQGQTAKASAPARSPLGIDAKPDLAAAAGGAAERQRPRVAGVESVLPPPAAEKPAEAEAAPSALAPAPHSTPPARRRLADADGAIPAGETAVHAAMAAPVWRPSASTGPTDFSVGPSARTQASASPSRRSSGSAVAQVLALSGQASRTVDSIPPAEPSRQPVERVPGPWPNPRPSAGAEPEAAEKVAPQSLAETPLPGADTQVRVLAPSTPDRDEVAFAVQLKAMPAPEETAPRESPVRLPEADGARRIAMPAPLHDVPAPEAAAAGENRLSQAREADQAPARASRDRHPEDAPVERTDAPAGAHEGKPIPHAAADAQVKPETAPDRADTTAAKPVRPQDAMESETRPEAVKAPQVRDMKFEVTGGEQRVEVRVSERGGEVKMTVRTPDTELAGTLRENLPTLSARLAESGFKSEAWHPAAASTSQWRHTAESSAGGASRDANTPSHQQDRESQDDAGQRRPKSPQEPILQKEKGKDFAWLMSTLR